tara:strand:- start:628 stop:1140 length:513 start_codon:yes stop_codon:yes gene_type:complete
MEVSCDKLNLLYLTNQTYQNKYNKLENDKTKKSEITIDDKDIEFYRKRIFQMTKELLRGKNINSDINNSFRNFAGVCINYFQFEDAKEVYQKEYENMKTNEKKPDLSFNEVEVNKFMMKSEKPEEPKTIKDFLNVKSTYKEKRRKIPIPKRKKINLKNEKFRTKGIESKK